jgi:hypothetical protein
MDTITPHSPEFGDAYSPILNGSPSQEMNSILITFPKIFFQKNTTLSGFSWNLMVPPLLKNFGGRKVPMPKSTSLRKWECESHYAS